MASATSFRRVVNSSTDVSGIGGGSMVLAEFEIPCEGHLEQVTLCLKLKASEKPGKRHFSGLLACLDRIESFAQGRMFDIQDQANLFANLSPEHYSDVGLDEKHKPNLYVAENEVVELRLPLNTVFQAEGFRIGDVKGQVKLVVYFNCGEFFICSNSEERGSGLFKCEQLTLEITGSDKGPGKACVPTFTNRHSRRSVKPEAGLLNADVLPTLNGSITELDIWFAPPLRSHTPEALYQYDLANGKCPDDFKMQDVIVDNSSGWPFMRPTLLEGTTRYRVQPSRKIDSLFSAYFMPLQSHQSGLIFATARQKAELHIDERGCLDFKQF